MLDINAKCVREIMLYLQNNLGYNDNGYLRSIGYHTICADEKLRNQYNDNEIIYTLEKLKEMNYIVTSSYSKNMNGKIITFDINDITVTGHEFIDNARNDTVWNKAMLKIGDITKIALPVLIEVLSNCAMEVAKGK